MDGLGLALLVCILLQETCDVGTLFGYKACIVFSKGGIDQI